MLLDLEIYLLKITFKYIYFYYDHLCMHAHVSARVFKQSAGEGTGSLGLQLQGL